MKRCLPLLLALFLFAGLGGRLARAADPLDVVYDSGWDSRTSWGPSQKTQVETWGTLDAEVADDFDMQGTITAVTAYGLNGHIGGGSFPPPFHGVYVRFYAYGLDGKPGTLQKEYFRPAGDAGLTTDAGAPNTFRVVLDTPFEVNGRHFLSVQPLMDPEWQARWYWRSAGGDSPRGQAVFIRDNLAGAPEWTHESATGQATGDAAFLLHGSRILPAPTLAALSTASAPQAGRIKLVGESFGISQGPGQVLINGVAAPVTRWSDTAIFAYVPDEAGLGRQEVRVVTTGGSTAPLDLEITPRTGDGRVRWRFQADAYYLPYPAATASDGSVYLTDLFGRLYALSAAGGVRWIRQGAIGTATLLADGGVVITDTRGVTALEPSGEVRWSTPAPNGTAIFAGPSLGPDGNLYAVAQEYIGGKLTAFSLATDGSYRWSKPNFAEDRATVDGVPLAFGADRFYFGARKGLYGVGLDGTPLFSRAAYGQPVTGPDGTLYAYTGEAGLSQLNPDGSMRRAFSPAQGTPAIGPDGVVYAAQHYRELRAFDPADGSMLWTLNEGGVTSIGGVSVGPLNDTLVYTGQPNLGESAFVQGIDIAGALLWRLELGFDNGTTIFPMGRLAFSQDGQTAYLGTSGNNYAPDTYAYFYALNVSGATDPGLTINPSSVTGGHRTTGRVTLSAPAPAGGTVVSLSSNHPAASVPATVTVRAGTRSATFPVTGSPVAQDTSATLTASTGEATYSTTVSVQAPAAQGLTLYWSMVYGGEPVEGVVTLSGPAPAGGWTVSLRSTNPAATLPSTVLVPEGADSVAFPILTSGVREWTDLEIIATAGGKSVSAELSIWETVVGGIEVDPGYAQGGLDVEGIVFLTGPAPEGGITVKLVAEPLGIITLPESVTVPAGQDATTFTISTTEVAEYTSVDIWAIPVLPGEETDLEDLSGATGTWIDLIPGGADEVVIQGANFSTRQKKLKVEAKSNKTRAVLKAYNADTGKLLGTLKRSGRRYLANFNLKKAPKKIRIRSSLRGGATGAVSAGR